MFSLKSVSAQAYASLTYTSFPFKYAFIRLYKASNFSGVNLILTSPHQTEFSVFSSHTTNLSFGDRPVNSPVSIAKAPVFVKTPCPFKIVSSTNSAGDKFQN